MVKLNTCFRLLGLFIICSLSWPTTVIGQANIAELKAGYLYNFTKFITWPEDRHTQQHFGFCVMQDEFLFGALTPLDGRSVGKRTIGVKQITTLGLHNIKDSCDVIYIGESALKKLSEHSKIWEIPILIVSSSPKNSHIFFFIQDNRLSFGVNMQLAKRSNLQLSSHLLKLARRLVE